MNLRSILPRVFAISFILNALWENAHAVLYVHYKGGAITEAVLLRAALFDASMITIAAIFFFSIPFLRSRLWLVVLPGLAFAVGLERFALGTGRWAYGPSMPLVPLLGVGFTPAVQLALLAWLAFIAAQMLAKKIANH